MTFGGTALSMQLSHKFNQEALVSLGVKVVLLLVLR